MKAANLNINLPLHFNQVVDLIKQLPYKEKVKLTEVLRKEMIQEPILDQPFTHFASETVLAKDWLTPQEDEVWKNL